MTSIDDPAALEVEDLAPHLDLFDPSHSERLWEVLSYARTACPVLKTDADEGYYIVTRYDDLRTVLEDPETYSSVQAGLRGVPLPMPPLTEDPPRHIEYRRALNKYLSRSFLGRYAADVRDTARTLLDNLVPRGRFDFMTDYAIPFTSRNLARVVLDDSNAERIKRAIAIATRISSEGDPQAFFDMAALAEEFLRDRGLDTTKAALGNIACHLAEDPTLEQRLRDPEWIKADLDEFLRYESPITFMARTVTRDTELGGCPLKPGDRVAVHYASANRDESRFEHADRLDFGRRRNPHAAFGLGPHRCIGMHFARLQIETAFSELFSRVTNLRIPQDAHVQTAVGIVLSPEHLPVVFDVRQA